MDCLAVAIAGSISMQTLSSRQILRASLAFGLFQAGMLVLGWLLGRTIVDLVEAYDHWVAFGLLLFIGSRMIWEFFRADEEDRRRTDITKGFTLLTLSVATSIDSLAVGLSLAFLDSSVFFAAPVIGSITFTISVIGFYTGKALGSALGRWAEVIGGIVLIGIGLRILLTGVL
jgi:putative Mn2+ efflux pump MntP